MGQKRQRSSPQPGWSMWEGPTQTRLLGRQEAPARDLTGRLGGGTPNPTPEEDTPGSECWLRRSRGKDRVHPPSHEETALEMKTAHC